MMDRNRDGRIALAELVQWGPALELCRSASKGSSILSCLSSLFDFLDADDSGELDFEECKSLFFIVIVPCEWCSACGKLLLESAYACVVCNSLKQYTTPRVLHPHSNFVEQGTVLMAAIEEIIDQIQCSVCKTYHRGTVSGALINNHIRTFEDNAAVCEWCIASACAVCGTFFEGAMGTATAGGWANKSFHICENCQPFRMMPSETSPADLYSEEFFRKLANSEVFEECSACIAKVKDGTLISEIVQGISRSTHWNSRPPFSSATGPSAPQYGSTSRHLSPQYSPSAVLQFPHNGAPSPHFPSYTHMHPYHNGAPSPHVQSYTHIHPYVYSPTPDIFAQQRPNMFANLQNSGFDMMGQNLATIYSGDPGNMQGLMQMIQSTFSSIGSGSDLSGFLDAITIGSDIGSLAQFLSMAASGCSIM
ncbi:hypothetical protein KP509_14G036800 [Ceratopteris richardii]|nr:hypothetical protein KP509_14G036800 [Ceratopteris richardii]